MPDASVHQDSLRSMRVKKGVDSFIQLMLHGFCLMTTLVEAIQMKLQDYFATDKVLLSSPSQLHMPALFCSKASFMQTIKELRAIMISIAMQETEADGGKLYRAGLVVGEVEDGVCQPTAILCRYALQGTAFMPQHPAMIDILRSRCAWCDLELECVCK